MFYPKTGEKWVKNRRKMGLIDNVQDFKLFYSRKNQGRCKKK
jgi:hypothetical protein